MKPRQADRYGLTIGGLAQLLLAVVVAACAGPTPRHGTSASPTPTATATAPALPPPDTDQLVSPWPGDRVISSRISHNWDWPVPETPYRITHEYQVPIAQPPAPPLRIGAGGHPPANPPYDQISFRFQGAFPSYDVAYTQELEHSLAMPPRATSKVCLPTELVSDDPAVRTPGPGFGPTKPRKSSKASISTL
jgi:hypothetical protein